MVIVIAALVGLYLADFTGGWSIWIASTIAALTVGFFTYHREEKNKLIASFKDAGIAFILTFLLVLPLLVIVLPTCVALLALLPWGICQFGG